MTIASETNKSGPYNGNGATTAFAGGFKIADETHVQVIATDADGIETIKTLTTHYTISGVGSPTFTVTMLVAPASGTKITIIRDVPFTQELDLENQGAYYAEDVEAAFDAAAARDQQLKELVDRSVKIPASADVAELDDLIASVILLGDSAADLAALAAISADVETLSTITAQISTVAGISTAVTTVAGISVAVQAVAAVEAELLDIHADLAALLAVPAAAAASAAAASGSASAASTSATAASTSAALAEKWASENEDVVVASGKYSAKHWAAKAAAAVAGVSIAVAADIWGKVSTKLISVAAMWGSAAEVTVTYSSSVALDFNTFINSKITLTGNITLAQPTNTTVGQSGCIRLIQDATGSRTVAFHADWKFAGGSDPTASTAANSTDLLYYHVVAANVIHASLNKAIA